MKGLWVPRPGRPLHQLDPSQEYSPRHDPLPLYPSQEVLYCPPSNNYYDGHAPHHPPASYEQQGPGMESPYKIMHHPPASYEQQGPGMESPYMIMIPSKQALATVMGMGGEAQAQQQQQQSQPHLLEEIERQRIEVERLKNDLERQRYNLENQRTKRENQRLVIEQQRLEMQEMRGGIDMQRREMEQMRDGIEQQRVALEGQRAQLEHGLYEREHQKLEADGLRHEAEQLRLQIEQYKAECERKNKQLQLLDSECARLETELAASRDKAREIQESASKLMEVHTSTQDQFLAAKETHLKLKSFIQDLTLKIHSNERELVSKDRELAALTAKKQSTEETSSIVRGEMKDTKKVLRRTAEVVETQQQLVEDLQRKLERSAKREKDHATEVQTLTAMYEDKLQKLDIAMRRDLHIKTTQSESMLSRLHEKVNILQAQLKDAAEKNDALSARVAVYEQDLISARRKTASLKEQLVFEQRLKEMNNAQLQQMKSERTMLRDDRGSGKEQLEAVVLSILKINETNAQNLDVVRRDVQDMLKLAHPPQVSSPPPSNRRPLRPVTTSE